MRIARSTGTLSGLLVALLGIWGALIPFVGPYFDYSFGTNATWHYTTDRLWLSILPGVLALLAGLTMILAGTRLAGVVAGWLGVAAGAWFVVGPAVSLTWEAGPGPIGRPLFGSTRQTLELVGYFYGLGALIIALSAFAIGRFASRSRLVEEAPPVADESITSAPPERGPHGVPAPGEQLDTRQAPPAARPAAGTPHGRTEPLGQRAGTSEAPQHARAAEPGRRRRAFPFPLGRRGRAASGAERG